MWAYHKVSRASRRRKTKTKDKALGRARGDRGVHVAHSANKQKVNTGRGNTVTLDAADCSSTCPLKFPRRPFCKPRDKSSAKSQHLFPLWLRRDKRRRKKAIQHLCLLRLREVGLSSPASVAPQGKRTHSLSLHSCQLMKSPVLFLCILLFGWHCVASRDAVMSG